MISEKIFYLAVLATLAGCQKDAQPKAYPYECDSEESAFELESGAWLMNDDEA